MLRQVESKIQELNEVQRQEYKKRKQAYLEEMGIQGDGKNKSNPVVTDEEFEELLKASFGTKIAGINKTARAMNVFTGLTLALGIVAGIAAAVFSQTLGFIYFSAIVFAAILVSMLFKGIGESIRLQQQLIDIKLLESKKDSKTITWEKKSFPDTQPSVDQQFANAPPVQQAHSSYVVNEP
ncbi:MAG: hypothetical protein ACI4SB_02220 [Acutalibacteraceae bacterium]